ncbi:MAG: hypothetical protein IJP84_03550 [Lachnospiraceae bacterium]|nr:hypothetical protein [Lachnospiraceae bacterium]
MQSEDGVRPEGTADKKNKGTPKKGEWGYLDSRHFTSLLRFILFGLITLILALCTWVIFPEHGKVFLILAVISAIPTAMASVNLIMYLRFKSLSPEDHDAIEENKGRIPCFYDSVLTTSEKSYYAPCIGVINKNLMLYSSLDEKEEKELIRHLTLMAKKNGFREWHIRVFKTREEFINRLKYLNEQNIKVLKTDHEMLELIGNLSL